MRVALQDKGLPDSGSTMDCLNRLSASSSVKPKKRKHHPGAASSAFSMSMEDARSKLSKSVASLPSMRNSQELASSFGLNPRTGTVSPDGPKAYVLGASEIFCAPLLEANSALRLDGQ